MRRMRQSLAIHVLKHLMSSNYCSIKSVTTQLTCILFIIQISSQKRNKSLPFFVIYSFQVILTCENITLNRQRHLIKKRYDHIFGMIRFEHEININLQKQEMDKIFHQRLSQHLLQCDTIQWPMYSLEIESSRSFLFICEISSD